MITCSRCGKENQKHYKFCLGCGAKLEAPAAPRRAGCESASAAAPAVLDADRPGSRAAQLGRWLVARAQRSWRLRPGRTGAPRPAPRSRPRPRPSSAPVWVRRPAMSSGGGHSGAMSARGASLPSGLSGSGGLGSGPAPGPVPGQSMDGQAQSGTVDDRDMIPCPNCGKPVVATYAFCGSCGQRMKGSGAAAGGAPQASARTMHMGSGSPGARAAPRGHLTLIRPDGTEGGVHPLQDGENLIGRGQGSLFDADPYLSPRHAEFAFTRRGADGARPAQPERRVHQDPAGGKAGVRRRVPHRPGAVAVRRHRARRRRWRTGPRPSARPTRASGGASR